MADGDLMLTVEEYIERFGAEMLFDSDDHKTINDVPTGYVTAICCTEDGDMLWTETESLPRWLEV